MFNSTYTGRSWFFLYGLTLIKDWVVTNWNCHSLLNFSKEATQDILAALQVDAEEVTRSILSLKDKARKLICEWLQQHCRASLSTILSTNPIPCQHDCLKEAFQISGVLMKTDYRDPRWHLLHIDSLLARGEVCSIFTYNNFSIKFQVQTNKRHQFCWWLKAFVCVFVNVSGDLKAAGTHLLQVFGQEPRDAAAQARWGVVESWKKNYRSAVKCLSVVSEKDPSLLDFLLTLIQPQHKTRLAQVT